MPTIDQGGNSFGTDMNIGTNDNYAVNIKTNNTNRASIDTNGRVGIGVTTPTQFNASTTLFPNLTPKVEVITGTSYSTAYNEGIVLRHVGIDVTSNTAVNRNVGIIFKLSSEIDVTESSKAGAIMVGSTEIYANSPSMNFYTGNNANPRMQILYNGSIKMSSLAGTGTRMVTVDSTGTLSANTDITSNSYSPSFTGAATSYGASGFRFIRIGNIIQGSGAVDITGANIGSNTFDFDLPVNSTVAGTSDLTGVVTGTNVGCPSSVGESNHIEASAGISIAQGSVSFIAIDTSVTVYLQFTYIIH